MTSQSITVCYTLSMSLTRELKHIGYEREEEQLINAVHHTPSVYIIHTVLYTPVPPLPPPRQVPSQKLHWESYKSLHTVEMNRTTETVRPGQHYTTSSSSSHPLTVPFLSLSSSSFSMALSTRATTRALAWSTDGK